MHYTNRKRTIQIPSGQKECPTCGRLIAEDVVHKTEVRIVRAHNNYGGAGPGDMVEIEPGERGGLSHAAQLATMSVSEYEMLQEAAASRPKAPARGQLAEMVEKALSHAKAEVKSVIERGKRRLEWQKQQAIAAGEDIPKSQSPSIDAERQSRSHEEVDRTSEG